MDPLAIPTLTKHVTDLSGVLGSQQTELLSAKFAEHENATSEQVLTVLIPHRQGNELRDIGLKLFNENGIGQLDLNNGLLLIVSTQEKRLRIVTGKGMEIKYNEMVCREIVEKQLRPLLNQGRYEEMIQKLRDIVSGEIPVKNNDEDKFKNNLMIASLIWVLCIQFGFIYSLILSDSILFAGKLIDILMNVIITLTFGMIVFILLRFFRRALWKSIISSLLLFFGVFLVFWLIFVGFFPPECTVISNETHDTRTCTRNVLHREFQYKKQTYTQQYQLSHPEQFRSSSSSSSSSYDGGGGSSNGGGYGD